MMAEDRRRETGKLGAGDDYVINDPIDGKQVSFRSRYGDPVSGIYRIAVYARRGQ